MKVSPQRATQLAEIVGVAVLFICAVALAVALGAIALGGWLVSQWSGQLTPGQKEGAQKMIARLKTEAVEESQGRHRA